MKLWALVTAVGGRLSWRFWWPLLPLLVDLILKLTMGQDGSDESANVLFLVSLASVPVLWLWGARFAIALGHSRSRVFPVALVLSLGVPLAWLAVGMIMRMLGGLNDAWQVGGAFLFYGMPLAALLLLGCCLWLGFDWLGAAIALGAWAVAAGLLFLVAMPALSTVPVVQSVVGSLGVIVIWIGAIWGGWQGFRVARA